MFDDSGAGSGQRPRNSAAMMLWPLLMCYSQGENVTSLPASPRPASPSATSPIRPQ